MTYRYREFPVPGIFDFFGGTGTGIGKNWYQNKSWNRYRKNLVPEKSIGIGIVKYFGYRHTLDESDDRDDHDGDDDDDEDHLSHRD